jgi:hypothetical protein
VVRESVEGKGGNVLEGVRKSWREGRKGRKGLVSKE